MLGDNWATTLDDAGDGHLLRVLTARTVEAGVKMSGGSPHSHVTPVTGQQIGVVPLPAEIDAANVGVVEAALASALARRPAVLIADGTQTSFCDSSGIAALIYAHRQAAATQAQLRVVMTGSQVRRVLELTGADQLLPVYPSLAAAQADGSHPSASPSAAGPERQEIA